MSKVSGYWQRAKECRGLAKRSRSADHRQMLLNIAATWESLADDRIRPLKDWSELPTWKKRQGRAVGTPSTRHRGASSTRHRGARC
jgi:hypothetical protein